MLFTISLQDYCLRHDATYQELSTQTVFSRRNKFRLLETSKNVEIEVIFCQGDAQHLPKILLLLKSLLLSLARTFDVKHSMKVNYPNISCSILMFYA